MEEYVRVEEAARRMGVTRQTVYRWIAEGHLQGYQWGPMAHGTYVRVADLDALQTFRPKPRD